MGQIEQKANGWFLQIELSKIDTINYDSLLFKKSLIEPWLVWLSGLSILPQTKRSPILGCGTGPLLEACNRQLIDVSLPLFLPAFLLI